jgi:hypothetical protein
VHLLFALEEPDLDTAAAVRAFVARLDGDREWCGGPLILVDDVDDEVASQPDYPPVWTLGAHSLLRLRVMIGVPVVSDRERESTPTSTAPI